jgi:hypothetical protein
LGDILGKLVVPVIFRMVVFHTTSPNGKRPLFGYTPAISEHSSKALIQSVTPVEMLDHPYLKIQFVLHFGIGEHLLKRVGNVVRISLVDFVVKNVDDTLCNEPAQHHYFHS